MILSPPARPVAQPESRGRRTARPRMWRMRTPVIWRQARILPHQIGMMKEIPLLDGEVRSPLGHCGNGMVHRIFETEGADTTKNRYYSGSANNSAIRTCGLGRGYASSSASVTQVWPTNGVPL